MYFGPDTTLTRAQAIRRVAALAATTAAVSAAPALSAEQMQPADPLSYASVDELLAMFRAKKASPVDLLQAQIKRIDALNPKVNCITYKHFDEALREAKQSQERYARGDARPLDGITVAIKDEFNRPGWRTTQGSLVFKNSPLATENSAVIDFLEAAGAIMPFQTTVPEFYLFLGASTRAWGTTHNPWNLEYSPGGSSAGSGRRWPPASQPSRWGRTWADRFASPLHNTACTASGRLSDGSRVAKSPIRPRGRSRGAATTSSISRTRSSAHPTRLWRRCGPGSTIPTDTRTFRGGVSPSTGEQHRHVIPSVKQAMQKGLEALRGAGCVVDEVDCGFTKEQKFVFMRGLFATSIGTLLEISKTNRDQLSPYMAEVLDLVGPVGPQQAEDAETLLEQLHRQVQQRVFRQGLSYPAHAHHGDAACQRRYVQEQRNGR